MVTEVKMYRDSSGEVHPSKQNAELAEAKLRTTIVSRNKWKDQTK